MKRILLTLILSISLSCAFVTAAWAQSHLRDLDEVRSSMANIGSKLPSMIKSARPEDMRTLERLLEINNYALMTIESYLKMLKISTISGGLNKEAIELVNRWLTFISRYCEADIKYLEEAKNETKEKTAADIIWQERNCIFRLKEAAKKGITENSNLFMRASAVQ